MAMTVAQAHAVNTLCNFFMEDRFRGSPVTNPEARDALALLAYYANDRLMAGWTSDRVKNEWGSRPQLGFRDRKEVR